MRATLAVILSTLVLASCSGGVLSEQCRQRINDCARTCPANTLDPNPNRPHGFQDPVDTRSECELRCRQGCTP